MFCIANYAKYNYIYNNSYNYSYNYSYSYNYKNKNKNNIKYRYNQVQGFWAVYPPGILTFLSKNEKLCGIPVEGVWKKQIRRGIGGAAPYNNH